MTAPNVKNCSVVQCFYNQGEICHANAILVGSDHPACDTFTIVADRHATPALQAVVGACHEADCKYNENLSCYAGSINVSNHGEHADCVTFERVPIASEDIDAQLLEATKGHEPSGSTAFRINVTE